jgi:anhydro-N-acetylmuramic acid kinase
VLNLGGIANITVLPGIPTQAVRGFDTGPANCLMDAWIARHRGAPRDEGGAWAAQGRVHNELLEVLLREPYFALAPPKSTGRELFNLDWLDRYLVGRSVAEADVQATLMMLTWRSVSDAILAHARDADEVLVCGGGVHNSALMALFQAPQAPWKVISTREVGVDPDFVEATAFAWLAKRRLEGFPAMCRE